MATQKVQKALKDPKHPRDYPIFRPYPEEYPNELLGCLDSAQTELELDNIRIMKHGKAVIAAYRFSQLDQFTYRLNAIQVTPRYRKMGLGKWLLAHALGIIESRSGRQLLAYNLKNRAFFEAHGFVSDPTGKLVFTINPE